MPYRGGRHLPNEGDSVHLADAILLERNDEWAIQRALYMTRAIEPLSDAPTAIFPAFLAGDAVMHQLHHPRGHDPRDLADSPCYLPANSEKAASFPLSP